MVWLSVGFRLRPTGCQPLGPPQWASLFVRSILLLAAPSLGPPLSGTPVQCRDLSHPRFPNHTNGHSSKSQSSGYRPRSSVSAGKITQVPVHKLATDLGFRHVDQVLEIDISHTESFLNEIACNNTYTLHSVV